MTRMTSNAGRLSVCLFGAALLAVPLVPGAVQAQTVGAPAAEAPKAQKPQKAQKSQKGPEKPGDAAAAKGPDRAAAEQAYATGVRAFDAGKLPEAVTALSNALMSGGLPNPQMARALYLRGQAYRKQGQAALAYTDLTSALWLKNGLAEPDKSKATAEREAAHREAGLGTQVPPVPGSEARSKVASPAQPAATGPKPGVDVAAAPTSGSFLDNLNPLNLITGSSSQQTAQPTAQAPQPAAQAPAPAAQVQAAAPPAAAAPVAAQPSVSSWSTTSAPAQPQPAAAPQPVASYAEPQQPQQQAAAASSDPLSTATNAVTGFFGSVFGSEQGQTATAQPSSAVTTASTGRPLDQAPPQVAAPAAVPAAPWTNPDGAAASAAGGQIQVQGEVPAQSAQKKPAKTQVAAVAGPQVQAQAQAVAQAIKPSASGKYRLQVATVNTREEADRIAASVAQNPILAGAQPEVDSVVYGNMGTFFRVRTGPYVKSAEPQELCKQLRPQGFDCLVVTQ